MLIAVALVFAAGIFLFFRGLATAPSDDLLETRLAQFRDQTITLEEIELQQPLFERTLRPMARRLGRAAVRAVRGGAGAHTCDVGA